MEGSEAQPVIIEKELSYRIVGAFFAVYNELGPGMPEALYSRALEMVLADAGIRVEREYPFAVAFRGERIGFFRVDLFVERRIIVEIKATERLDHGAFKQLRSYLAASGVDLGILLYFGAKPEFHREIRSTKLKVGIRAD